MKRLFLIVALLLTLLACGVVFLARSGPGRRWRAERNAARAEAAFRNGAAGASEFLGINGLGSARSGACPGLVLIGVNLNGGFGTGPDQNDCSRRTVTTRMMPEC